MLQQRALCGFSCYPLCLWFLSLTCGHIFRQMEACAIPGVWCWRVFDCHRYVCEGISGFIINLARSRHHHHSADTYAVEDAVPVLSPGTVRPGHFRLAGDAEGYRTARARLFPKGISPNFSKNAEVCTHGYGPVLETSTACVTPAHTVLVESCRHGVTCCAIRMASP